MKKFLSFFTIACAVLTAIVGCGGGGSGTVGGNPASDLTLAGTAATGLAIASAPVTVKCQSGSGTATTGSDGTYQLVITSGSLPCVLEVTKPDGSGTLHSVATGSASSATANITPLTEMVTAKLLATDPAIYFAAFNASNAASTITTSAVQTAQTAVVTALSGTVDASTVASLISTPMRAATTANPSGGDVQDQLLDALKTKLTTTQQTQVVSALASNTSPTAIKSLVGNSATANLSQLTSTLNLDTNTLVLRWTDSFPAGTNYRVEMQNADGSFSLVETLAGVGGGGTAMQWQRAVTVSASYRVVAVTSTNVVITTPQGQDRVSVVVPSAPPTIVSSQTEPLSGTATLSLSGSNAYSSVSWYVDLRLIGTTTSTGATNNVGNPITWNTSTETNSTHLVLARVQTATDSYTEVRRTLNVANSNLALSATVSASTGTINIDASASSQYGIARVEGSFDGATSTSLTEPNACSRFCSTNNLYRFSINAATAGSGSHTMVLTAIDSQGARKTVTVAVPISNLPVLTLSSPSDGAFVSGTLTISGSSTSDKTGALTTTASLGDYQFMSTTNANFSGSMNLASLPAGPYTLTVRSTDSSGAVTVLQRTVSVTSGSGLAYTPNFSMGVGGQLIRIDDSNPALVLYRASDGSYRVRNTTTNAETTLQGASTLPYLYNWAMDGGYVYVEGGYLGSKSTGYADCPVECIFQWSPSGARTNLSTANPNVGIYEQFPRAHGGNVIWINAAGSNPGTFTRYNVATGSYSKIAQPAGANYLINTEYDFYVDGSGNVVFFYCAQSGGEGVTSTFDVYRWNSTTNTSTKLSSGGARSIYPKTDGQRVVWQQTATDTTGNTTLLSQAVAGGAITTLTSSGGSFQVKDGVAAWLETTTTTSTGRYGGTTTTVTALKASTTSGTTASTVSTLAAVNLYAVGGGKVVFGELGKVYSWSADTKTSTLLMETAPTQVTMSGSTMYFVMGTAQAVYKLVLQ